MKLILPESFAICINSWKSGVCTLLCGIIVLHILLIFDFFPCLHALLGTARLLIFLKISYLHVYLELKINCFRENLSILLDV